MKINNVNRFQVNPVDTDQPRSRLGRSFSRTQTFLTGKLVPIYVHEVLPNETLKLDFSSLVRSITPAVPVMDNAFIDYFFFFVPNRLCTAAADDWQKVCGENKSGYWAPNSEATLTSTGNYIFIRGLTSETIGSTSYKIAPQSLLNYLGAPVLKDSRVPTSSVDSSSRINTLAPRAYYSIWNEWFRDENTQAPYSFNANILGQRASVLSVNKFHDIFTSALQAPQKGQSVMLPLGTTAPVLTSSSITSLPSNPLLFQRINGEQLASGSPQYRDLSIANTGSTGNKHLVLSTNSNTTSLEGSNGESLSTFTEIDNNSLVPNNLYADLSNATAATVNELRNAFAIQRLLEKDARGGKPIYCLL